MIVKRLHTKSKIFFPEPYMVRVEFSAELMGEAEKEYRKITRSAYRLLKGTWGYSQLEFETWTVGSPSTIPYSQLTPSQQISNLFAPDYEIKNSLRGYICFADEMDALQFRLTISAKAIQVYMWPIREFTIHEIVEMDES